MTIARELVKPVPGRPGWYYDIIPLFGGRFRMILTNGTFNDDLW